MPEYAKKVGEEWHLNLWVQPGAKKSQVDGIHDQRLKIRLQAPPVEGKANKALVVYMAKLLGVKKRNVRIVRGEKNRRKTLSLEATTAPEWPS